MLENFSNSWYDAFETQLRTRVRGSDSLQVSYTYSKSNARRRDLLQTFRGTERTPREEGDNPTDTPHNLSVAASTNLPWAFQLSGVFRAISGGPLAVTAGTDLDGDLNTQNDRPEGLPHHRGSRRRRRAAGDHQRLPRHPQPGARQSRTAGARPDHHLRRAPHQGVLAGRQRGGSRPSSKRTTPPTTRPSPAGRAT